MYLISNSSDLPQKPLKEIQFKQKISKFNSYDNPSQDEKTNSKGDTA